MNDLDMVMDKVTQCSFGDLSPSEEQAEALFDAMSEQWPDLRDAWLIAFSVLPHVHKTIAGKEREIATQSLLSYIVRRVRTVRVKH